MQKLAVKQVFSFSVFLNGELTQNVSIDTLSSIFDVISKIFFQVAEYLYKLPKDHRYFDS